MRKPTKTGFYWRVVCGSMKLTEVKDVGGLLSYRFCEAKRSKWHLVEEVDGVHWDFVRPPKTDRKVVTVRMSAQLHDALKRAATDARLSLNELCLSRLDV